MNWSGWLISSHFVIGREYFIHTVGRKGWLVAVKRKEKCNHLKMENIFFSHFFHFVYIFFCYQVDKLICRVWKKICDVCLPTCMFCYWGTPSDERTVQQLFWVKKHNTTLCQTKIDKHKYRKMYVAVILLHSCLLIFIWWRFVFNFLRPETIVMSFLHLVVFCKVFINHKFWKI